MTATTQTRIITYNRYFVQEITPFEITFKCGDKIKVLYARDFKNLTHGDSVLMED